MRIGRPAPIVTILALALFGLVASCSTPEDTAPPIVQEAVYDQGPLDYLVFLPREQKAVVNGKYPMILSLSGIGERGNTLQTLKRDGLPKILDGFNSFPFIVVSPQCPSSTEWYYDRTDTLVTRLLDLVIARYPIDTNRIYITGYSMGGIGTWDLAIRNPKRFAAIAPIAARREGGWDPCSMKTVPVWAFHGEQDDVVQLYKGQDIIDAFRACGGEATFTVYPGIGHDAWTRTYNNPELYNWMLRQSRPL